MQYQVLSPIRHDGKAIAPGELIDLGESQATALLASGAVEIAFKPYQKCLKTPRRIRNEQDQ
jgi:hypothetical protein